MEKISKRINNFLENLDGSELIKLYGMLLSELKSREIIRSNNVVGDLGEYLAVDFYNETSGLPNLQAAPTGTQNVDALSRNGERYSIKTITGRVTGVFYGLPHIDSKEQPQRKFEYVIIVKLDKDYKLEKIIELSWEKFLENKRWHKRMEAWNLSYSKNLVDEATIIFPS